MTKNLLIYLAKEKIRKLIQYCKDPEWTINMRHIMKTETQGYLEALEHIALELDYLKTREIIIEMDKELIYFNVYTGECER